MVSSNGLSLNELQDFIVMGEFRVWTEMIIRVALIFLFPLMGLMMEQKMQFTIPISSRFMVLQIKVPDISAVRGLVSICKLSRVWDQ